MLTIRNSSDLLNILRRLSYRHLSAQNLPAVNDEEYTAKAEYPEIKDLSFRAKKRREQQTWYESIQKTPTVEEKLIKINMPRYYGYKVNKLTDEIFPYNCLPAIQHYTRTAFEKLKSEDVESKKTSDSDQKSQTLSASISAEIKDALELVNHIFNYQYSEDTELDAVARERVFSQQVVEQLNRVLVNALVADHKHLNDTEVDLNPRHEAFWVVGGIDPPKNTVKSKEGRKWQKEMAHDPVNRYMQYKAKPYLTLRHRKQLTPWKSVEESNNLSLAKELPRFNYDPRALGFGVGYQHGTNIPGYWPGSPNNFGLISYQSRAHMQIRPDSYGAEDFKEVLDAQAVLSSYAWLLAQANYNGFNTFSELTYPMNTQTIITNGRDWSFYEYQLNTLLLHSEYINENPMVNFCRGTDEMQLYQEFDDKGKCIGFNEKVVEYLIKFYTNAPTIQRTIDELTPYLHPKYKTISDYPNEEQRIFLDKTFKHMVSNRPRHLPIPEIYLWEKIYKIDHNTRPLEARRRYFERGINPWKRTLDQHQKEYIPRALRENGPKDKKNKWKKTYYP